MLSSQDTLIQVAQLYPTAWQTMTFGDTDHDGHNEAAFYWRDPYWEWHYVIHEEQGNNVYSEEYVGADMIPYVIGDLDRDGKAEIIGQSGYYVRVYESSDTTSYPTQLVWSSPALSNIEGFTIMGDTDQDGRMEIIHSVNSGYLYIFENSGDNNYETVFSAHTGFQDDGEKVIADFDGDGFLEIAFCGGSGRLHVYESPADNTWTQTFSDTTGLVNAYGTEGGVDTDGNGIPELFVAGDEFPGYMNTTIVLEAVEDNQFVRVATLATDGAGGATNALGDLEGDRHFKYVTETQDRLWFYKATTTGRWEEYAQMLDPTGLYYNGIQVFDVNGNGRSELFWDSSTFPTLVLEHPSKTSSPHELPTRAGNSLQLVPNPCRRFTAIVSTSNAPYAERLSVYDVTGRLIERLRLARSQDSHLWDAGRLSAGVYYVQLESRDGTPLARCRGTVLR